MKFQNICLYETGRVAVSVRAISSDVWWRRILHEYLHVLNYIEDGLFNMTFNSLGGKNVVICCYSPFFATARDMTWVLNPLAYICGTIYL